MNAAQPIVVDSSALMALLLDEPEADAIARALADAPSLISMATWLEVAIVADGRSASLGARLDTVIAKAGMERVDVTEQLADAARAAHRRFGRGSGSKARLNYGDCFAYALSSTTGRPLLFVGDDFTHTDLARVPLD